MNMEKNQVFQDIRAMIDAHVVMQFMVFFYALHAVRVAVIHRC